MQDRLLPKTIVIGLMKYKQDRAVSGCGQTFLLCGEVWLCETKNRWLEVKLTLRCCSF